MFQRIHTYHRILDNEISYLPRAYGDLNPDGSWNGYLAFFPRVGTVVSTDRLISEPTLSRLKDWAGERSVEDLYAALTRAKALNQDSLVDTEIARLKFLENEAELDADALDEQADITRAAAADARADATRLKQERRAYEADAARLEEQTATEAHEVAAGRARVKSRRVKHR